MIQPSNQNHKQFSWDGLYERAAALRPSFGAQLTEVNERVYLIVTNTVFRELDSQSQRHGYALASKIKAQFRLGDNERSFLAQCTQLGFVETLAVSQAETKQVSSLSGQAMFPNTVNDSRILTTAEQWTKDLMGVADVVFITEDSLLAERARRFSRLATTSVHRINAALKQRPHPHPHPHHHHHQHNQDKDHELWSASFFRQMMVKEGVAFPRDPNQLTSLSDTLAVMAGKLASDAALNGNGHEHASTASVSANGVNPDSLSKAAAGSESPIVSSSISFTPSSPDMSLSASLSSSSSQSSPSFPSSSVPAHPSSTTPLSLAPAPSSSSDGHAALHDAMRLLSSLRVAADSPVSSEDVIGFLQRWSHLTLPVPSNPFIAQAGSAADDNANTATSGSIHVSMDTDIWAAITSAPKFKENA